MARMARHPGHERARRAGTLADVIAFAHGLSRCGTSCSSRSTRRWPRWARSRSASGGWASPGPPARPFSAFSLRRSASSAGTRPPTPPSRKATAWRVRVETEGALLQTTIPPRRRRRRRAGAGRPAAPSSPSPGSRPSCRCASIALTPGTRWRSGPRDDPPQPLAGARRGAAPAALHPLSRPQGLSARPAAARPHRRRRDPGRGLRQLRRRHARGGAARCATRLGLSPRDGPRRMPTSSAGAWLRPGRTWCTGSSAGATPSSAAAAGSSGCATSWCADCRHRGPCRHDGLLLSRVRLRRDAPAAALARVLLLPTDPDARVGSRPSPALDAVRGHVPTAGATFCGARRAGAGLVPGRASFLVLSARAAGGPRTTCSSSTTKPFAPALAPATGSASRCAPIRSSPGADPRTGRAEAPRRGHGPPARPAQGRRVPMRDSPATLGGRACMAGRPGRP